MAAVDLEGATVVVTGGHGFLGGHVSRMLTSRGAKVHALGRADYDLCEQAEVRQLFRDLSPDVIVHLAAAVGGIGANVANPGRFLHQNALMGLMLLDEARLAETRKFVMVSTPCAYPQDAPLPLREDDLWAGPPTGATGPYGMAKRLLHEACRTYAEQYAFDSVVLVLANLYGPEDHFDGDDVHVIPAMIRRYADARRAGATSVTNWGSGRPTREFLHAADAARAVVRGIEVDAGPEPINIGTGVETSIGEVTHLVASSVKFHGEIAWDTSKPDGQPARYFDVSRAADRLGFRASIDLAAGVDETVNWFLDRSPYGSL